MAWLEKGDPGFEEATRNCPFGQFVVGIEVPDSPLILFEDAFADLGQEDLQEEIKMWNDIEESERQAAIESQRIRIH